MDVLTAQELSALVAASTLVRKYDRALDSESAFEILSEKMERRAAEQEAEAGEAETRRPAAREKSTVEAILESSVARQVGRTAASILTRSLLGALGLNGGSRRRSRGLF
jgi:hypothetical protein